MRTYREYYNLGLERHNQWLSWQKNEWWKENDGVYEYKDKNFKYRKDHLDIQGDYLETVNFKSRSERNNSSIFDNHTNVTNREWDILFDMLGQALIDWCVENKQTEIYAYELEINRVLDGNTDTLDYLHVIKTLKDNHCWEWCNDEKVLKKFEECSGFLTDIIYRFISEQGKDIPNDWNYFAFGLDSISVSCEYKEWTPESDGSMTFGCYHMVDGDEELDTYVHCN